jgi:hypothetical protein
VPSRSLSARANSCVNPLFTRLREPADATVIAMSKSIGLLCRSQEDTPMVDRQEAQKTFAGRWFEEVWNKSRREAIDEMFPEDGVLHDGSADYRGPEAFKRF